MRSKLRIATSYVFLSLCMATVYLWIESYSTLLTVGHYNNDFDLWQVESFDGRLKLVIWTCEHDVRDPATTRWLISALAGDTYRDLITSMGGVFFDLESYSQASWLFVDRQRTAAAPKYGAIDGLGVAAPHWFFVSLFGVLAVGVRPKPRFRFSLRDAMAITTMVAAVVSALGAFVEYAKAQWG